MQKKLSENTGKLEPLQDTATSTAGGTAAAQGHHNDQQHQTFEILTLVNISEVVGSCSAIWNGYSTSKEPATCYADGSAWS